MGGSWSDWILKHRNPVLFRGHNGRTSCTVPHTEITITFRKIRIFDSIGLLGQVFRALKLDRVCADLWSLWEPVAPGNSATSRPASFFYISPALFCDSWCGFQRMCPERYDIWWRNSSRDVGLGDARAGIAAFPGGLTGRVAATLARFF